jgi:hypothetical protein
VAWVEFRFGFASLRAALRAACCVAWVEFRFGFASLRARARRGLAVRLGRRSRRCSE